MCVFVRFKTADDKTSMLFHNDHCKDHGSLSITVYNSGMIISEVTLSNKRYATTVVFAVGLDSTRFKRN